MNKEIRKVILQALLVIGLIVFALWFALKDNAKEIMMQLSQVTIPWLLFLLVIGIVYYVLQGIVLYLIAKPYESSLSIYSGIENAYIAAFFNGVTPLGGGQVAQTYAFRKYAISYSDIAAILWKDFYLYQSVVVAFAIVILTLFHPLFLQEGWCLPLITIGLLINTSVVFILWTMKHFPNGYLRMSDIIANLLYKVHIIKHLENMQKKSREQLAKFQQNITVIKKEKGLVIKVVTLYIIRQLIYYSIPFFAAMSLNVPVQLQDIGTVMALACAIHMLNALTPLPGDSGFTESMFILLFALIFTRMQASAIMLLWRFVSFYINMLIGAVIFFLIKTRGDQFLKQIDKESIK